MELECIEWNLARYKMTHKNSVKSWVFTQAHMKVWAICNHLLDTNFSCKISRDGPKKAHNLQATTVTSDAEADHQTHMQQHEEMEQKHCECMHAALGKTGDATTACAQHHAQRGKFEGQKKNKKN